MNEKYITEMKNQNLLEVLNSILEMAKGKISVNLKINEQILSNPKQREKMEEK